MTEQAREIAKKRIAYEVAGTVNVRRDLSVAGVTIDIYESRSTTGDTVLIVSGYPDGGFQSFLGCRFKEMGWTVSWAELLAATGLKVITYSAADPLDVHDLLRELGRGAIAGIDATRIGILASSGSGPVALSLLHRDSAVAIRCAALLYAFTIDLDGSTHVADAAKRFGFKHPDASELRDDVPLLLVRAGRDENAGLNDALDAFAALALRRNLPLTLVNHPTAPHAFDLFDTSAGSRDIIRQTAAFLRSARERQP